MTTATKYTREELEAMPARELDAVVAEAVFGWGLSSRPGYGWPVRNAKTQPVKCAAYSTNIGAAWRLMETMQAKGWYVRVSSHGQSGEWTCTMKRGLAFGDRALRADATARSAPTAVAIAAILAVQEARATA